jgi:restriction system protein
MDIGVLVLGAILLGVLAFVLLGEEYGKRTQREADAQAAARHRERRLELLARFHFVLEEYGQTLWLRVEQASFRDAYGRWILDKASKELEYFFKEVVLPEAQPRDADEIRFVGAQFDEWIAAKEASSAETVDGDQRPPERRRDGRAYERLVAAQLAQVGFDVQFTPATGDQGVDLVASRPGTRIAIQCKDYGKPVGNEAVQQVYAGAKFYAAERSIVVAPNDFTIAARQLASSLGVQCLHHEELSLALAGTSAESPAA